MARGSRFSRTQLTRALREWVEGELSEVATQIERVQVSRDSPEDRDGESGHARLQLSTRVVGQLP